MRTRIMTVDLEPDLGSNECKSMTTIVPKLLQLFDKYNIKATFFVVSSLLERYSKEIKEIAKKHEIASHSHTHASLTEENALSEIKTSKEAFAQHGIECKGFRAPRFITTKNHHELLAQHGYQYDASLARYFPKRYRNKNLPKQPFVKNNVYQFPMTTFIPPTINSGLSYLKLFHPVSKLFPKPYMFYLHPWEFLEKTELSAANTLISKALHRNTGTKAWSIFENYIKRSNCQWVSCEEWIKRSKD